MPEQRRPNVLVLAAIAIAVLAVVAIVVSKAGGGDDDSASSTAVESGNVEVNGQSLPQFDGSVDPDPAVGQVAPVVKGVSFDGSSVTIGDKGPAVIVFVAHWCPHCRREVPFLVQYFQDNGVPDGVSVQTVATAIDPSRPNYPPSAWLAKEKWTFPTLVDASDDGAANAFGLTSFPYFVVLGKDGKVVQRTSGELDGQEVAALFTAATGG